MFQLAAGDEWWLALLRTNVLPSIARHILSLESVRNYIFPLLSQIGISYRHSSLSRHADDEEFRVKAGDRMPYVVFDDTSVYDRLREPRFHLLYFSKQQGEAQVLKTGNGGEFSEVVDFHSFPITDEVAEKFGNDRPFYVFLRLDNYIGFISLATSKTDVEKYLSEFVHWRSNG